MHEVIVAAKSQREALAAWGIERNLFAVGRAYDTRDPAYCAVALASPGQVFARTAGAAKPFKAVRGPFNGERAATLEDDGSSK